MSVNYVRPKYYDENTLGPIETIIQVFENEEYLPSWFDIDINNVKVIVDIGAMIGSFSLWAAQKFPASVVYCYEPDPESFEYLKKNIEASNLQNRIKSENFAVLDREGKSIFYRYKKTPSCNSLIYNNAPGTVDTAISLQISTKPFSDILQKVGKIDFLKMDCEGSEFDILYSLKKPQLEKIQYLVLEYHDFDNDQQKNSIKLLQFLRDSGFAAQKIPTDVRKNKGAGYIYASRKIETTSIINSIFDGETKLIEKYLEIPGTLQDRLIILEKEFDERSKWALELDKVIKEKDSTIVKLRNIMEQYASLAIKEKEEIEKKERITIETQKLLNAKLLESEKIQDENLDLKKEIANKDYELNVIKQSFLFKKMRNIAYFVDKVAPKGTTRGEILRLALESIRIIQTNGWSFYFLQCRTKIRSVSISRRIEYKIRKSYTIPQIYLETRNISNVIDNQIISCNKKLEPDVELRNFLKNNSHNITDLPRKPLVSIIIPTYNAIDLLKLNIESIESLTTYKNYEIIIITNNPDPNSPTRKYLEKSKHQVLIYDGDYSFSKVNNFASKKTKGEFLVFLNDDIKISSKNWLEAMLKLGLDDKVGAVGAKLLFPDGKLQEAGGIIWRNGFGWNYGRNKDPNEPLYNFVREVDYCSASCLMVKRKVFDEIGGFDEGFQIAYCEDSDLCFAIRNKGYKVLYQPLAEVIHFEGSTQGTDISNGIKSQQLENQKIFYKKWKEELQNHHFDSEENSYLQSRRKPGLHILYIDHYVPEYDKDAGSVTAFNFICVLASMGHKITFWPENLNRSEPYTTELQQKHVEVIYGHNNFEEFIKKRSHVYAICVMARPHISIHFIDKIKEHAPKCKIIYEASDLHFVRIFREAEISKSEKLIAEAESSKKTELELMNKSHLSLFRGEKECAMAIAENKSILTAAAPLALYYDGKWKSFDERKDLVFVGGYNHPPNVDAVEYFISDIFPIIQNKLPDIKFYVIGSNVPEKIKNLCSSNKNCILVGYVPDLSSYLLNCRVMVAPLRYGAGVKGKITQSMTYHLPVVTTSIGAEGISEKNDDVLLISDDPTDFANKVIKLYENKELWTRLADKAYEFADIHYSPESVRNVFSQIIQRLVNY
ncbi:MAG: FkbM family methyltransferase [Nitrososphaera sp.]